MAIRSEEYSLRVSQLRSWMSKKGVDACIFMPGTNMLYLSGTRNAGLLAVPLDGDPFLLASYAFGDALAAEESPLRVETVKPHYGLKKKDIKRADLAKRAREILTEMGARTVRRLGVEKALGDVKLKPLRKAFRKRGRSVPFEDAGKAVSKLRMIKSEAELSLIRRSANISADALNSIVGRLRPGVTEREVANELEYAMRKLGASKLAFPSIVAFGVHTFNAHHVPTEMALTEGDLVLFDWGASYEGYASDQTRTFVFGRPNERQNKVFEAVKKAQEEVYRVARAGVKASEPDIAARKVLSSFGFLDEFVHSLGHGVGLDVHEMPRLFVGSRDAIKKNMVITNEPGVYIDGWGGVRIEDTMAIGRAEAENLSEKVAKTITLPK